MFTSRANSSVAVGRQMTNPNRASIIITKATEYILLAHMHFYGIIILLILQCDRT